MLEKINLDFHNVHFNRIIGTTNVCSSQLLLVVKKFAYYH